jgi:ASC-1-like (ASCH) protein
MKKIETDMDDELRPEYDLRSLRVRKLGRGRKSFGEVIRLEPDVAEVFPDAESVNEALRFLIRVTRENKLGAQDAKGNP